MAKPVERTWRVQVFTDRGVDPRIEFLRESVKTYPDGDVVATPIGSVERRLSTVASTTLPGGTRTVRTVAELFALVAEIGHAWAAEDVKVAQLRAAELQQREDAAKKAT